MTITVTVHAAIEALDVLSPQSEAYRVYARLHDAVQDVTGYTHCEGAAQ